MAQQPDEAEDAGRQSWTEQAPDEVDDKAGQRLYECMHDVQEQCDVMVRQSNDMLRRQLKVEGDSKSVLTSVGDVHC
ncbi:hypothetical protein AB1Y20_003331 [Prymnesium parvum]|uniref:V-SNARE coiled-coil homology domain-containing protein n=1 Tax=Prymnesium parvum TaxID=97485 RepID=A0AB34JCQ8_PRYPA